MFKKLFSTKWKNIHPDFTRELKREWKNKNFTYEQTREWINVGLQPTDATFTQWLRDIKKLDAEWVLDYGDKKVLRKKYSEYLRTKELLEKKEKEIKKLSSESRLVQLTGERSELQEKNEELRERYQNYGLCAECQQPNTGKKWCQSCNAQRFQKNFPNWTSGDQEIDLFIQKCQLKAKNWCEILEWMPYYRFKNIKYLSEGGFSKIYKAECVDGYIKGWDIKENKWERYCFLPRLGMEGGLFLMVNSLI